MVFGESWTQVGFRSWEVTRVSLALRMIIRRWEGHWVLVVAGMELMDGRRGGKNDWWLYSLMLMILNVKVILSFSRATIIWW